jgi:hypothetical protein
MKSAEYTNPRFEKKLLIGPEPLQLMKPPAQLRILIAKGCVAEK